MDESIDTDDLIDLAAEYIAYLRIERGSSPRTIEAYEADLETYRDFLSSQGIEKLSQVSRESIVAYQEHLFAQGYAASTVCRRASVVKGFHRFCVAEDYTESNPAAGLPLPKMPERLPDVLSIDQVQRLFEALEGQEGGPAAVRNRAMLEVLYGCGLRVSELCGLDRSDVVLDQGYLLVLGKGGKQRISPISGEAGNRVGRLPGERAPAAVQALRQTHRCRVLERPRRPPDASKRVQSGGARGPCHRRGQPASAHAAPFVRNAYAAGRGGPARYPGHPGAFRHLHHAGLHPRRSQPPARGISARAPARVKVGERKRSQPYSTGLTIG